MKTQLPPLSQQARSLEPGALYRHYSGKEYKLLSVARHSETLEEMVIYQSLYGSYDVWCRPLAMFLEQVTKEGKTIPRFKAVGDFDE